MLATEIIEDSLLSFLTQEAPNVDVDGETVSQKVNHLCFCKPNKYILFFINLLMQVLSKIKVGPSSLAFLAKTALMGL